MMPKDKFSPQRMLECCFQTAPALESEEPAPGCSQPSSPSFQLDSGGICCAQRERQGFPEGQRRCSGKQRHATSGEILQMSLTSVVSWSLVSGYKTLLGAGQDPRCSPTSEGSSEAQKAVMEPLQTLLLPLLLVMCPPVCISYPWKWRERGGGAKAPSRALPTPYVAFLQGKDNHSCGGFLVAPGWVMTAAQCLVHKPLTVILGAHTLQRREGSWQTFQVKEYHCHSDFTSPKKGNDILLLKLNGSATINSHVRPISFEKAKVRGGAECSVAGWGYRTATVTSPEATVTVIKQRDCLSHYPGLADNLICGRSRSSGVPEKGDAGDPLVCNNKAYGIFSYRHNNWPGFYTHIAPYLPWVNSVMKSA